MDRPVWTDMHSLLLETAEGLDPLPNLADPTDVERDLVAWGLLRWDAGAGVKACRTTKEYAPLERVRVPQARITPAGLALLAALEALDGTAAPSEQLNPRPESTTVGDHE